VISGNPRSRANSSSENASRVATPAQPPERYPDAQSVRIVTTPVGSHGRNRCFFVGNYGLALTAHLLIRTYVGFGLIQICIRLLNDTLADDYRRWYPGSTHTDRQDQAA
jgi:hypothetical protein